jgi:hypothetical protein
MTAIHSINPAILSGLVPTAATSNVTPGAQATPAAANLALLSDLVTLTSTDPATNDLLPGTSSLFSTAGNTDPLGTALGGSQGAATLLTTLQGLQAGNVTGASNATGGAADALLQAISATIEQGLLGNLTSGPLASTTLTPAENTVLAPAEPAQAVATTTNAIAAGAVPTSVPLSSLGLPLIADVGVGANPLGVLPVPGAGALAPKTAGIQAAAAAPAPVPLQTTGGNPTAAANPLADALQLRLLQGAQLGFSLAMLGPQLLGLSVPNGSASLGVLPSPAEQVQPLLGSQAVHAVNTVV